MKLVNKLAIIFAAGTISFGTSGVSFSKETLIQKTLKNYYDTSRVPEVMDKNKSLSVPKSITKELIYNES